MTSMMSRTGAIFGRWFVGLSAAVGMSWSVVSAEQLPFGPGERLVYELSWFTLIGGTATLDVQEAERVGTPVFRFRSTAKSNAFVSMFFPVEDHIESLVDQETLSAIRLDVKQRQGKRRRNRVTEFDQVGHVAINVKNGQRKIHSIPPRVQDSLSCLYYFRSLPPIRVGETVTIDVHEGGKNWKLAIKGLNRQKIRTPVGEFQAIRTSAHVEFEGVFLEKGEVFIWFTDDARRLPVQMESRIKIGRVSARLIEYRPGLPPVSQAAAP